MRQWWKQRWAAAGVVLAVALAGAVAAQQGLFGEPRQFSDVPSEGFDFRRGVPTSEEDWHPVPSFSRYDEAVEYTARRGWFEGFPDGSFRPEAELTSGQLVKVIERAFPDGMTRAQAAAFLQYGEWGADLTPGRWRTNAIPKGSTWRVGGWDITVRQARTAPDGDSSVRPSGHSPVTSGEYHIVELEVVWRGSGPAPRFNLNTDLTFGALDVGDCEVDPVLPEVTVGTRPGAPVVGNLCWQLSEGTADPLFFADLPPDPKFYTEDLLNEYENPYGYGALPPYWAWMSLE